MENTPTDSAMDQFVAKGALNYEIHADESRMCH